MQNFELGFDDDDDDDESRLIDLLACAAGKKQCSMKSIPIQGGRFIRVGIVVLGGDGDGLHLERAATRHHRPQPPRSGPSKIICFHSALRMILCRVCSGDGPDQGSFRSHRCYCFALFFPWKFWCSSHCSAPQPSPRHSHEGRFGWLRWRLQEIWSPWVEIGMTQYKYIWLGQNTYIFILELSPQFVANPLLLCTNVSLSCILRRTFAIFL